jgi:hypothetical protein
MAGADDDGVVALCHGDGPSLTLLRRGLPVCVKNDMLNFIDVKQILAAA